MSHSTKMEALDLLGFSSGKSDWGSLEVAAKVLLNASRQQVLVAKGGSETKKQVYVCSPKVN